MAVKKTTESIFYACLKVIDLVRPIKENLKKRFN